MEREPAALKDKPSIINAVIISHLLPRSQMHSHVYCKFQSKRSYLASWVGYICLFQALIKFISPAENPRPKLCQFCASNKEVNLKHIWLQSLIFTFQLYPMPNLLPAWLHSQGTGPRYFFPTFHLVLTFFLQKPQNLHSCLCLKDMVLSKSKILLTILPGTVEPELHWLQLLIPFMHSLNRN